MTRKKHIALTENEVDVLQILWSEGRPLSRPEILERSTLPDSNKQSLHRYLNDMLEIGVLTIAGSVICGKRPGRTYAPTITREEYVVSQLNQLIPAPTPRHRLLSVMSSWVGESYVDEELISELEELLQKKRKDLHDK